MHFGLKIWAIYGYEYIIGERIIITRSYKNHSMGYLQYYIINKMWTTEKSNPEIIPLTSPNWELNSNGIIKELFIRKWSKKEKSTVKLFISDF